MPDYLSQHTVLVQIPGGTSKGKLPLYFPATGHPKAETLPARTLVSSFHPEKAEARNILLKLFWPTACN